MMRGGVRQDRNNVNGHVCREASCSKRAVEDAPFEEAQEWKVYDVGNIRDRKSQESYLQTSFEELGSRFRPAEKCLSLMLW